MATRLGLHAPRLESVRQLRTKSGRRELGRFAVDGRTMLDEALSAGAKPEALYATERAAAGLGDLREAFEDRLFIVPDRALGKLSELETPPGLVTVFPMPEPNLAEVLRTGAPIVLLAGVADPGNAGTLLRTAEIFGIGGAIFTNDAVEAYNPKVVRATMGAIFRLPIATAGPADIVAAAGAAGYTIVGTARSGTPLPDYRFPERPLIAIGNERRGVAHAFESWDESVAIPQRGRGESLNAAVAGGIILFAFSQWFGSKSSASETSKNP